MDDLFLAELCAQAETGLLSVPDEIANTHGADGLWLDRCVEKGRENAVSWACDEALEAAAEAASAASAKHEAAVERARVAADAERFAEKASSFLSGLPAVIAVLAALSVLNILLMRVFV